MTMVGGVLAARGSLASRIAPLASQVAVIRFQLVGVEAELGEVLPHYALGAGVVAIRAGVDVQR